MVGDSLSGVVKMDNSLISNDHLINSNNILYCSTALDGRYCKMDLRCKRAKTGLANEKQRCQGGLSKQEFIGPNTVFCTLEAIIYILIGLESIFFRYP